MSFNANKLARKTGDEAEQLNKIHKMFAKNSREELLERAAEVDLGEIGIKNFDN